MGKTPREHSRRDPQASNYTHSNLINNQTYYYRIAILNAGGEGPLSETLLARPTPSPVIIPPDFVFSATAGDGQVELQWQTIATAASYKLYRHTNDQDPITQWVVFNGVLPGAIQTNLSNNHSYFYRLAVLNSGGETLVPNTLSVTPQQSIPGTPMGLIAVADGTHVSLNWPTQPELSYTVYWNTDLNTDPITSNQTLTGRPTLIHPSLNTSGTTYRYQLTASNNAGESPPSTIVEVQLSAELPVTPTGLAVLSGDGQNNFSWNTVTAATQYTVEWSLEAAFTAPLNDTVLAPVTQYVHSALVNDQTVYYRVIATNTNGNSPPSEIVSGTPTAGVPQNQAPVIQQGATVQVNMDEDSAPQAFILVLNAIDANNDTLNWQIITPATNGEATIDAQGNQVNVNYVPVQNYNGTDSFNVEVNDAKGGLATILVNVTINPINDPPTDILLNNNAIPENSVNGTAIATLSTQDVDNGDTHVYTLTDNAGGRFNITGTQLEVLDGTLLDFESASTHTITIKVQDQAGTGAVFSKNVVINVTDVNEPPVRIPTNYDFTKAGYLMQKMEFNDIGEGVATWLVDSFTGYKLVGAQLINGSWGAEKDLAYFPDRTAYATYELKSNGSSFMVVWSDIYKNQLVAKLNIDGIWQEDQIIASENLGVPIGIPQLYSNGSSYIVIWSGIGGVFANTFSTGKWQQPKLISNSLLVTGITIPLVATNGDSYVVAWTQSTQNSQGVAFIDLYASVFDGIDWITTSALDVDTFALDVGKFRISASKNGGDYVIAWKQGQFYSKVLESNLAWGPTEIISSVDASSYFYSEANLVSNGTSFTILWFDSTLTTNWVMEGVVKAGVMNWEQPVALNQGLPNSPSGIISKHMLVSNGSGYLSVWFQGNVLYTNVMNSVWTASDTVELVNYNINNTYSYYQNQPILIATRDSEYAVAWSTTHIGANSTSIDLTDWIAIYNVGWNTPKPKTKGSTVGNKKFGTFDLKSNTLSYMTIRVGNWVNDQHVFATEFKPSTTTWEQVIYLDQLIHAVSSYDPKILVSNSGNKLAVWKQHGHANSSDNDRIYASVFSNNKWSVPRSITSSRIVKGPYVDFNIATAANSNGFALAWLTKRTVVDGEQVNAVVQVWDGKWLPPTTVFQYSGTLLVRQPFDIESNGVDYLFAWGLYGRKPSVAGNFGEVRVSRYDGINWITDPVPLFDYSNTNALGTLFLDVESNGKGYAVAYETSSTNPKTVNLHVLSDFSTQNVLEWKSFLPVSANGIVQTRPKLVSDSNSYAIMWNSWSDSYINIFNPVNQNWVGELLLAGNGNKNILSNRNGAYAIIWGNLVSMIYKNNSWTSAEPQVVLTPQSLISQQPVVSTNGNGFAVSMLQNYSQPYTGVVVNRSIYQNGVWIADSTVIPNISKDDPVTIPNSTRRELGSLASNGVGYSLVFQGNQQNNSYQNYIVSYRNGQWLDAQPLGTAGFSSYQPSIVGRNGKYSAVWLAPAPEEPNVRVPFSADY